MDAQNYFGRKTLENSLSGIECFNFMLRQIFKPYSYIKHTIPWKSRFTWGSGKRPVSSFSHSEKSWKKIGFVAWKKFYFKKNDQKIYLELIFKQIDHLLFYFKQRHTKNCRETKDAWDDHTIMRLPAPLIFFHILSWKYSWIWLNLYL